MITRNNQESDVLCVLFLLFTTGMSLSVRCPNRKLCRLLLAALVLLLLLHATISGRDGARFDIGFLTKDRPIKLHYSGDNQLEPNTSFINSGLSRTKELETELKQSNLTEFWRIAGHMLGQNELYPEDFNVSIVVNKMATSKIVTAQRSPGGTSFKWKIRLEGGQYAIFKPQLV